MTVKATPNSNFSQLGGTDPHDRDEARYREYRAEWEGRPLRFEACEFPVHLDLEASSRCNLKCTFCDKLPFLPPEKLGDMDFDLFTRIVGEGVEKGLYSLKLSYRGEPLLNKRLPDMIRYAKDRGILDIYFNTNGMLLTEKTSRALIEADLDRISVSVEGTDPDAFASARIGADFDRIRKNLKLLLELRNELGVKHPVVRVQTVTLPGIDLDEYARYWGPYSDETAAIDFKDVEDETVHDDPAPGWACPQPWQRMTIEWDGTMHPCNNDDQDHLSLGNANDVSVTKAWTSEAARNLRDKHRNGNSHLITGCAICPWRAAQLDKRG